MALSREFIKIHALFPQKLTNEQNLSKLIYCILTKQLYLGGKGSKGTKIGSRFQQVNLQSTSKASTKQ